MMHRIPIRSDNPDLPEVFWRFYSSKSYAGSRLGDNGKKFFQKLLPYVNSLARELTENPPPPAKTRYTHLAGARETAFKINGKAVFLMLQVCYDRRTKTYEEGKACAAPEEEIEKILEENQKFWESTGESFTPSDN